MNKKLTSVKTKYNPIDTKNNGTYNKTEVIMMKDYSRYPDGNRYYSGAERKKSILINTPSFIYILTKEEYITTYST